ncbi:hypothetical protein [Fluviispira multicolorata]|uniref:Uncharacterized protein n=1 Tax=Fluviispira multicolorata TaxID=2654512 RepID=A0A833JDI9_9BACT|nr:hypothetical protein [Fluviispira multicolorata]KAB8031938.1 hypothetical protein GCL57_04640 [Fluviispira multicolorata]
MKILKLSYILSTVFFCSYLNLVYANENKYISPFKDKIGQAFEGGKWYDVRDSKKESLDSIEGAGDFIKVENNLYTYNDYLINIDKKFITTNFTGGNEGQGSFRIPYYCTVREKCYYNIFGFICNNSSDWQTSGTVTGSFKVSKDANFQKHILSINKSGGEYPPIHDSGDSQGCSNTVIKYINEIDNFEVQPWQKPISIDGLELD